MWHNQYLINKAIKRFVKCFSFNLRCGIFGPNNWRTWRHSKVQSLIFEKMSLETTCFTSNSYWSIVNGFQFIMTVSALRRIHPHTAGHTSVTNHTIKSSDCGSLLPNLTLTCLYLPRSYALVTKYVSLSLSHTNAKPNLQQWQNILDGTHISLPK